MYFYFHCPFPAAIKLGGIIYGTFDRTRLFNITEPFPFTEICPLFGEGENFNFFITENFLENPPEGVLITDLGGGYMISFSPREKKREFGVLAQKKFRDASITLFCENGYKISLDANTGFYAETLAFTPLSADFYKGEGKNADLLFAFFKCNDKKVLNVYKISQPALLMSAKADEFYFDSVSFKISEKLADMAKHTVEREYSFDGNVLSEINAEISADKDFNRDEIAEIIIPYAFSEEFLCGGDYSYYLAENVKENASKLKDYLGEFIGVIPPPPFRNEREIGLVKKISAQKYRVDYFVFETLNRKITNILKV